MIPISYNIRSLAARRSSTLAAGFGVALVVFIFASVLMLSNGITDTLRAGGSDDNAIVLRKGSQAEIQSNIEEEKVSLIRAEAEVASGSDGPLVSPEVVVIVTVPRVGTAGVANVTVRGVSEVGMKLHDKMHVVAGRPFRFGSDEVIVGRAIVGRLRGLALDQPLELKRNRAVRVVGIMEADGSGIESEVWGDLATVRAVFGREGTVSSILFRLKEPSALSAIATRMDADPRLGLAIKRETTYFEEQAQDLAFFLRLLGLIIAVFFSLGAMIGAMITMYAQISARTREIGTLRALGFRWERVLLSFLIESILLSLAAGVFGCLGALGMSFVRFATVNFTTFSEVVFRFTPTLPIMLSALGFATAMGLLGGLLPALRAARVTPVQAMRE